jgi:ABC-type Fe3+ transport system permease subunit
MEDIKMEKKYLGGRLDRKVTFGLIWLLQALLGWGWILAFVIFIMDKDNLDTEDMRELVSCVASTAICSVLGMTIIVPLYFTVCSTIACIMAFIGKKFDIPGSYHLAKLLVK